MPTHAGPYELLDRLAKGGMAELYLAQRTGSGGFRRLVAVKRILPHLGDEATFREMFLNEGRIAAQLTHPNICQVHDLGEDADGLYLAMEYLEGVAWETFSEAMPRDATGTFLRLIAGMLQQLAAGLGFAHNLRDAASGQATPVIHRDISPQNVYLTVDGICKVLDFGVAKVVTEGRRTRSGVVKGKLAYMAPEQLRGETLDVRADIFAVGIVLWELLTGQLLFDRSTDFMVWQAIQEAEIPPPSTVCPHVTAAVDAVVLRALNRDVTLRYATMQMLSDEFNAAIASLGAPADGQELRVALQQFCPHELHAAAARLAAARRGQPRSAETVVGAAQPNVESHVISTDGTAAGTAASTVSELVRAQSRRTPRLLAATVLAAAGIGGAVWFSQTRNAATTQTATTVDSAAGSQTPANPTNGVAAGSQVPTRPTNGANTGSQVPTSLGADAGSGSGSNGPPGQNKPTPVATGTGYFSIDSTPFANIYADGKLLGETPLFRVALRAGSHSIRAVLADNRSKSFTIKIRKGETLAYGSIAW